MLEAHVHASFGSPQGCSQQKFIAPSAFSLIISCDTCCFCKSRHARSSIMLQRQSVGLGQIALILFRHLRIGTARSSGTFGLTQGRSNSALILLVRCALSRVRRLHSDSSRVPKRSGRGLARELEGTALRSSRIRTGIVPATDYLCPTEAPQ